MQLFEHQKILLDKVAQILKQYNLCYLAAEERVGKTLVALKAVEQLGYKNVCVITKKAAIGGWEETLKLSGCGLGICAYITNVEQIRSKGLAKDFDMFIIDEAHHAFSAFPKPSKTCRIIQDYTYEKPLLLCSATPNAESYSQLFHQLNLTKYSPFDRYANFYAWFKDFGVPKTQFVKGFPIKKYDEVKAELLKDVFQKYFVFMTRREAGFTHLPEDDAHFVGLSDKTIAYIKELEKTGCIKDLNYTTSSAAHTLVGMHQLEGGTLKNENFKGGKAAKLGKPNDKIHYDLSSEKVDYILQNFGDSPKNVIFYNYVAEFAKLSKVFKHSKILQGTRYAEGVDLSDFERIIVYSMNFSAAKYIQRRARQCNMKRDKEIKVVYLLCKGFVSEAIFQSVCIKNKNFTRSVYEEFKCLAKS